MSEKLTIHYQGQAPSKANFRRSGPNWRSRWRRIKEFEEEIGTEALAKGAAKLRKQHSGPVKVHMVAYNQRADCLNIHKAVEDSLQGICYETDRDTRGSYRPVRDKGPARLIITITFS